MRIPALALFAVLVLTVLHCQAIAAAQEIDPAIPPLSWEDLGNPFQRAVAIAFSGDPAGGVAQWAAGLRDFEERRGGGKNTVFEAGPEGGRGYFETLGLTPWPPDFTALSSGPKRASVFWDDEASGQGISPGGNPSEPAKMKVPLLDAGNGVDPAGLSLELKKFEDAGLVASNGSIWGWKPVAAVAAAKPTIEDVGRWAFSVGLYREARDCFSLAISGGNLEPELENAFMTSRAVDSMLARLFAQEWDRGTPDSLNRRAAAELILYFTEAYSRPWWWLTSIRLESGDPEGAAAASDRARDHLGKPERIDRARALFGSGRIDEALAELKRFRIGDRGAASDPGPYDPDPGATLLEAELLERAGRPREALEILEGVTRTRTDPDGPSARCKSWTLDDFGRAQAAAGRLLFDAGKYPEALVMFAAAGQNLGVFPDTFLYQQAVCKLRTNDREGALKDLVSTVGSASDCAESRRLLALELLDPACRLHDPEAALEHARKAVDMCGKASTTGPRGTVGNAGAGGYGSPAGSASDAGTLGKCLLALALAASAAGEDLEARKTMEEFRKRFPDEKVPPSLARLITGK